MECVAKEGMGRGGRREGGREVRKRGVEGKGRRVDLWGLKRISIHGEEEATDSRETEGPDWEAEHKHKYATCEPAGTHLRLCTHTGTHTHKHTHCMHHVGIQQAKPLMEMFKLLHLV